MAGAMDGPYHPGSSLEAPPRAAYRRQPGTVPADVALEPTDVALNLDYYLRVQRERHQRAHGLFEFRYYLLTGPQLVLAAGASITAAMWPEDASGLHTGKAAAAVLGGLNTLLVALSAMLQLQAKKEMHAQAVKVYDQLLTDFRFCVMWASRADVEPGVGQEKLSEYLQHAHKRLSEVHASLPRPPDHILREVARDFGDPDGVLDASPSPLPRALPWLLSLSVLVALLASASAWGLPWVSGPLAVRRCRLLAQVVALAGTVAAIVLLTMWAAFAWLQREASSREEGLARARGPYLLAPDPLDDGPADHRPHSQYERSYSVEPAFPRRRGAGDQEMEGASEASEGVQQAQAPAGGD